MKLKNTLGLAIAHLCTSLTTLAKEGTGINIKGDRLFVSGFLIRDVHFDGPENPSAVNSVLTSKHSAVLRRGEYGMVSAHTNLSKSSLYKLPA